MFDTRIIVNLPKFSREINYFTTHNITCNYKLAVSLLIILYCFFYANRLEELELPEVTFKLYAVPGTLVNSTLTLALHTN